MKQSWDVMTELRDGHNPRRYQYAGKSETTFLGKATCGTEKLMKIRPNEPPPYERNQEEPSMDKVLLIQT